MSSPVVDGVFVYGFGSRRKGQLFCLDARPARRNGRPKGAPARTPRFRRRPEPVVLTTEGELLVVRRTPEKFEELRRYKVADTQTWAQPALVAGGFVIRDADSVALWSLR